MKKNAVMRTSSGALAGVFASFFTHPMDVVRARLTVQDQSRTVYNGNHVLIVSFTINKTLLLMNVGMVVPNIMCVSHCTSLCMLYK